MRLNNEASWDGYDQREQELRATWQYKMKDKAIVIGFWSFWAAGFGSSVYGWWTQ